MTQLPFMRAIKSMSRPQGIAMRPRPAAGIAHMGRLRSPIRLADGGSTSVQLPDWLNAGIGALGGALGVQAYNYANNGRPDPINSKPQNNPFAIPMIHRTIDPNSGVASQQVRGWQGWPGSNLPTGGANLGIMGNYAPGSSGQSGAQSAGTDLGSAVSSNFYQNIPGLANAGMTPQMLGQHQTSQVRHYAKGGGINGYGTPGFSTYRTTQKRKVFFGAVQALSGGGSNPQAAIKAFVSVYGPQALRELQAKVASGGADAAQQQQPGFQGPVKGPGDGMTDSVAAQNGQQPIQLSNGEHVVPADAVAMIGNGSSDAGHAKLQQGIASLRRHKYGRSKQPPMTKGAGIF